MSDLLKKIIKSQTIKEGRFYANDDGKVYERIVTGEDTFTGYYQDVSGTLYTEEGWTAEKKRQYEEFEAKKQDELKRAQAERDEAVLSKREEIKKGVIARGKRKKNFKKVYITLTAGFIMVGVLGYGLWERNKEAQTKAVYQDVENNEETIEEPKLFGNAIITGDDVNLRSGPSTDDEIITSLGNMGERVELVVMDSTVAKWEKIRREDGTKGWVYDLYLKKLDSLDY